MQPYLILPERPAHCSHLLPDLPAYLHLGAKLGGGCISALGMKPVSYTHLDVYKRQAVSCGTA